MYYYLAYTNCVRSVTGELSSLFKFYSDDEFLYLLEFNIALEGATSRGSVFYKSGQFVRFDTSVNFINWVFAMVATLFTILKASKTKYSSTDACDHCYEELAINYKFTN